MTALSTGLISLDDPEALDPALVGRKAATLAAARQAGLPVLPGIVVAVGAGRAAVELGARTLEADGPGRARLAVDRCVVDGDLVARLEERAAELGDPLIVRSSTALDGDGRWSGAFTSVGDVRPTEVAGALRGCWSSIFRPDALKRFDLTGVAPRDVGMAVLVQRQLQPSCGGLAEVGDDGRVSIWAAAGAPGPLLAGLAAGVRGSIDAGATIDGGLDQLPVAASVLQSLAAACRAACEALGSHRVEWAVESGQTWILQLDRGAEPRAELGELRAGAASGHVLRGAAASPGVAAGRPVRCRLSDGESPPSVAGAVLVLDEPLPIFAPLLWEAAAVIAMRGDPAAHLCEVARSLHVPAVVGLDSMRQPFPADWDAPGAWLTVDGDAGEVAVSRR